MDKFDEMVQRAKGSGGGDDLGGSKHGSIAKSNAAVRSTMIVGSASGEGGGLDKFEAMAQRANGGNGVNFNDLSRAVDRANADGRVSMIKIKSQSLNATTGGGMGRFDSIRRRPDDLGRSLNGRCVSFQEDIASSIHSPTNQSNHTVVEIDRFAATVRKARSNTDDNWDNSLHSYVEMSDAGGVFDKFDQMVQRAKYSGGGDDLGGSKHGSVAKSNAAVRSAMMVGSASGEGFDKFDQMVQRAKYSGGGDDLGGSKHGSVAKSNATVRTLLVKQKSMNSMNATTGGGMGRFDSMRRRSDDIGVSLNGRSVSFGDGLSASCHGSVAKEAVRDRAAALGMETGEHDGPSLSDGLVPPSDRFEAMVRGEPRRGEQGGDGQGSGQPGGPLEAVAAATPVRRISAMDILNQMDALCMKRNGEEGTSANGRWVGAPGQSDRRTADTGCSSILPHTDQPLSAIDVVLNVDRMARTASTGATSASVYDVIDQADQIHSKTITGQELSPLEVIMQVDMLSRSQSGRDKLNRGSPHSSHGRSPHHSAHDLEDELGCSVHNAVDKAEADTGGMVAPTLKRASSSGSLKLTIPTASFGSTSSGGSSVSPYNGLTRQNNWVQSPIETITESEGNETESDEEEQINRKERSMSALERLRCKSSMNSPLMHGSAHSKDSWGSNREPLSLGQSGDTQDHSVGADDGNDVFKDKQFTMLKAGLRKVSFEGDPDA